MISLVTGGCGFIGSHIVDRLLEEGHTVRVIDNFTTGRPANLDHQKGNKNLTVYQMDIRNKEEIAPVFEGVDYVFHLAALADIVPSIHAAVGILFLERIRYLQCCRMCKKCRH